MTPNPEPMVQQLQHDFQNLLAYVTGPKARSQTAYTGELTLFQRLLAQDAALLRLFLVRRAAVRPPEPVTAPDGTRLTAHDWRPTTYYSVFGNGHFARHSFTAPGQEGFCPLDAELSFPAPLLYSDRLRECASLWGERRVLPREPNGPRTHHGAAAQPLSHRNQGTDAVGEVTAFYGQPAIRSLRRGDCPHDHGN